jgi:ubiquinone biosynthesis protein
MRESLILLLDAVVKNDAKAATEAYLEMIPASETVDQGSLVVDIRAALYDINRSDQAHVSIGDAFESLLRAGTRNGVHNPAEFLLLARTFVILESMSRQLAPDHDYMKSFREETSRLTAQHFSLERIEEKTSKLAREVERLTDDGPGDVRRALRHIAEGDLGRVQAPALEALGVRVSHDLERLGSAIAFGALVMGGSLLILAGPGWHHTLGEVMVVTGFAGMILIPVGGWLRSRARR